MKVNKIIKLFMNYIVDFLIGDSMSWGLLIGSKGIRKNELRDAYSSLDQVYCLENIRHCHSGRNLLDCYSQLERDVFDNDPLS